MPRKDSLKSLWRQVRAPLLAGLALRLLLPWYGHGFRWDDEHWQVIEPANHLVHGAWSITTEWREGLRSWIYPGLISLPLRLARALGLTDALHMISFTRMTHGLLMSAAIPLVYSTTRALSAERGPHWARLAAWMTALWPFAIYCGFHTHGEMSGALFILGGVAAPALIARESTAYALSGLFFGIALAFKIDLAVAGLGFGVWQLVHLKLRRAAWLVAKARNAGIPRMSKK